MVKKSNAKNEDMFGGLKKLQDAVNNNAMEIYNNSKANYSMIQPTGFATDNIGLFKQLVRVNSKTKQAKKIDAEQLEGFKSQRLAVPLNLVLLMSNTMISRDIAIYLDSIGIELRNFVVDYSNFMYPLYYADGIHYYSFMFDYNMFLSIVESASKYNENHNDEVNDTDTIGKMFIFMMEKLKVVHELFNSKKYRSYMAHIDTPFKLMAFERNLTTFMDDMTADEFTELFVGLYQSTEYGFNGIDWSEFDYYLKDISDESDYHPSKILEDVNADENGYIRIYRGANLKSMSVEDTRSWTWDKKVALKFADRFQKGQGTLHTAMVHVDDILLYIGGGEREVLVEFENIEMIDSKQYPY